MKTAPPGGEFFKMEHRITITPFCAHIICPQGICTSLCTSSTGSKILSTPPYKEKIVAYLNVLHQYKFTLHRYILFQFAPSTLLQRKAHKALNPNKLQPNILLLASNIQQQWKQLYTVYICSILRKQLQISRV